MTEPKAQWGPDDEELAVLRRFANWTGDLTGRRTPNLNAALSAFQGEIKSFAPEDQRTVLVETKGDKPNYSYKYATLATLLDRAGPLMAKNGLSFSSMPTYADPGDGKVTLCLSYTLAHSSGEERSGLCPIKHEGSIQSLGGVITYLRRYCQAAALGIAAEMDDDGMMAMAEDGQDPGGVKARASGGRTTRPPAARSNRAATPTAADALPATVPAAMKNHMFGLLGKVVPKQADAGADRDVRLGWVSGAVGRVVVSSNDLTREEVQRVIDLAQEEIDGRDDAAPTEDAG